MTCSYAPADSRICVYFGLVFALERWKRMRCGGIIRKIYAGSGDVQQQSKGGDMKKPTEQRVDLRHQSPQSEIRGKDA